MQVVALDKFLHEFLVIMCARAAGVMAEDVLVERWAFGDRNIFRNDGFQHIVAIAFAQLLANVIAHPAAASANSPAKNQRPES